MPGPSTRPTPRSSRLGNATALLADIGAEQRRIAFTRLSGAGLTPAHAVRAGAILNNPDSIQQGAFGICGLVSILKPMAIYAPDSFIGLATQAFSDTAFDTTKLMQIYRTRAAPAQQTANMDFDYLLAHWLLKRGAAVRAPGSELTHKVAADPSTGAPERQKKKKATDVFDDQTGFSNTFNIAGWEELGHYATTAGGLTYLLDTVLGAPNSRKIKVTDIARDFQVATGIVGRKGKVVAAVKDTSVYKQGGTLVSTPPKDAHRREHGSVGRDVGSAPPCRSCPPGRAPSTTTGSCSRTCR